MAGCGQAIPKQEEAAGGLAKVKSSQRTQELTDVSPLRKVHTSVEETTKRGDDDVYVGKAMTHWPD